MSRPIVAPALIALAAAAMPSAAQATQDTPIVRIGTLGGLVGTLYFGVSDINDRGTAVGRYSLTADVAEGALVPKAGTPVRVSRPGRTPTP